MRSRFPRPPGPQERIDGQEAKRLLLDVLLDVEDRLSRTEGYTAVFHKQERIHESLGEEQILDMKVRHEPFSLYLKFRNHEPGKEVVYNEDRHDGDVIAHATGLAGRLIPRLKVPPDHPIAMTGNRHPVTEAGVLNLAKKLVHFRRMDLHDPEAVTILDRMTDDQGRTWLRSIHTHPHQHADRPFARVEVLYDPETLLPVQISNYDWPETPGDLEELKLAEKYQYEDLQTVETLSDMDFDPANPDYAFTRY